MAVAWPAMLAALDDEDNDNNNKGMEQKCNGTEGNGAGEERIDADDGSVSAASRPFFALRGAPPLTAGDNAPERLRALRAAGLSISLTFGGRRVVGVGFGVPLILRYVLQTCETAEQAGEILARVPTHMSYNVTVLDRKRKYLTALMAPDRPAIITKAAVATNHQENVEWISHARFTATVERERYLLQRLRFHRDPEEKFINTFLKPPLYSHQFNAGFGTLYTAVYRPRKREMEHRWPGTVWHQKLDAFEEGSRNVLMPGVVA